MVKPSPAHARPSYDDKKSGHWPIPFTFGWNLGRGMPGVNRICNTKVSRSGAYFELFLRQCVVLRNNPNNGHRQVTRDTWLGRQPMNQR
jgi:hypothetical protein